MPNPKKTPFRLPPNVARDYSVTPKEEVARYDVLRGFSLGEGVDVYPGDEVILPVRVARGWCSTGRLKAQGATANDELEDGDPELEHASPGLTTRTAGRGRARAAE